MSSILKYYPDNRICKICLKKIPKYRPSRNYCSDKCKYMYDAQIRKKNAKYQKEYNRKNNNKPYKEIIKKCKYCKKDFLWTTSRVQQIYCSKECCKKGTQEKNDMIKKGIIIGNGKSYNYYRLRFNILKRDNFTCQYCGRNAINDNIKIHLEHIIPVSKGGRDEYNNLITSCEECNGGKLDVLLEKRQIERLKEYLQVMKRGVK